MDAKAKYNDTKSCDKINFYEKKATCKVQNFFLLLIFLLITIALLGAVKLEISKLEIIIASKHIFLFSIIQQRYLLNGSCNNFD